jgi:hypothetical protein
MAFQSRKGAQANDPAIPRPATHQWPPACVARSSAGPDEGCDFVGEPNGDQSPYLACGGDLKAHYRFPVEHPTVPAPAPEPVVIPARPARPVRWTRPTPATPDLTAKTTRVVVGRVMCPVCRRPDTALIADGSGGEVVAMHGPVSARCRQSENPLPAR